ncbi:MULTISPECIES: DUF7344 domain-containing protein [Halorussus]|uniref:DUF7344 domain-containing protein n=1 Tax=Halorussus TaxID=1070314 RepID=UPI00209F6926|nr:hypothetical protein [Halorussus vallis]USZ76897.1 hypothetical protein NGM07_06095 [Halorussus vallis]
MTTDEPTDDGGDDPPDDREDCHSEADGVREAKSSASPEAVETAEAAASRMFAALADDRRRFALYYLREAGSATVEELATVLVGWLGAREEPTTVTTPGDRRSVQVSLVHAHLPKLAEAGLVDYDEESGTVTLEPLADSVERTLDRSFALERVPDSESAENRSDERRNR